VLESGLGLTLGVEIFSDGTIQQAKDFDYGLGSYDEDGEVTPFSGESCYTRATLCLNSTLTR